MRRYLTPKERRDLYEGQDRKCALCYASMEWGKCIAEHWTPVALGNDQKPDCLLCIPCADRKTNGTKATTYGSDKHAIAKVKRLRGETKQGPKKKIQGRGFTGWRKFNGDLVKA